MGSFTFLFFFFFFFFLALLDREAPIFLVLWCDAAISLGSSVRGDALFIDVTGRVGHTEHRALPTIINTGYYRRPQPTVAAFHRTISMTNSDLTAALSEGFALFRPHRILSARISVLPSPPFMHAIGCGRTRDEPPVFLTLPPATRHRPSQRLHWERD